MKKTDIRKLATAAMLVAVAVICSPLSIPVGASKCFPIQHLVNVIAGVFLGPWYAVGAAFCTSLIRNLLGTGSLLAFPGSMCGALLCGLAYKVCPRLPAAYAGEVFGTGVLGAMASYPVAAFLLNNRAAALFTFVPSFLVSTAVGAAVSVTVLAALGRTGALGRLEGSLR